MEVYEGEKCIGQPAGTAPGLMSSASIYSSPSRISAEIGVLVAQ